MKRASYIVIWAAISLVLGAIGSYFFNLSFWLTSATAAVALIINGLIADVEDKNDQN
jgi:hypothetical protein